MLRRHRQTALVALAAAFDAFVHVTDLLTAVGAGLANRCASFAVVRMVIAVATHEVDAGCTSSDAIEHQLDVRLLDVVAAFGQAMTGQHVSTGRLAFSAVFDALFHGCGCGSHSFLLVKSLLRPRCRCINGMQLAYRYGVYWRMTF